jgi:hypothetical protein
MRNRIYLLVALLVLGSSVVIFGASRAGAAKTVTLHGAALVAAVPCTGTQLTLEFYDTDAAMGGVRSSSYAFKNSGTAPCSMTGFPAVRLLDRRGRPVRVHPVKHSEDTPAAVELAPGGQAYFRLDFSAEGAGYEGPRCARVHKLSVGAPGTTRRFIRNDEVVLCGDITVTPVGPPPAAE